MSREPIKFIYEDADILIINKPIGWVVHPGTKNETETLVDWLKTYTELAQTDQPERPGIVHRLDKDTEGLMIVAKTMPAYSGLIDQFINKKIEKKYYAMVRGNPLNDDKRIDQPIGRSRTNRIKQIVGGDHAKPATTLLHVLRRYQTKTLLELTPITGRTHQLRVHLAHIGHPVMGDILYGPKTKLTSGQLLQAYSLKFAHPISQQIIQVTLPLSSRLT